MNVKTDEDAEHDGRAATKMSGKDYWTLHLATCSKPGYRECFLSPLQPTLAGGGRLIGRACLGYCWKGGCRTCHWSSLQFSDSSIEHVFWPAVCLVPDWRFSPPLMLRPMITFRLDPCLRRFKIPPNTSTTLNSPKLPPLIRLIQSPHWYRMINLR